MGGDLNLYFLSNSAPQAQLTEMLVVNALVNVIKQPTRIQLSTSTCIDAFITNCQNQPIDSGVLGSHISDHLPIYIIQSFNKPNSKNKHERSVTYRNVNQETLPRRRSILLATDWRSIYSSGNATRAYELLIDKIKTAFTVSFPYIKKTRPRKARKPWLTSECLKAIIDKNALFQRFLR